MAQLLISLPRLKLRKRPRKPSGVKSRRDKETEICQTFVNENVVNEPYAAKVEITGVSMLVLGLDAIRDRPEDRLPLDAGALLDTNIARV